MYLAKQEKKDDDDRLAEEEEEGDLVFDQVPVKVVCPHCRSDIITFIEHEASWVTYAVCLTLLMVLNWAAICIVPAVFPLFKDVVHHCPRCLSILARRSRVVLPSVRQEVMSFRFGSCAIVLARKYVVMMIMFVAVIMGIHFVRSSGATVTGLDAVERGELIGFTWQDFIKDCGFKSYLGNPIHVTVAFNEKYKNKTFHWTGAVHHLETGFDLWLIKQRGSVFVQMDPPQFPSKRGDMPDLMLMYQEYGVAGNAAEKLKRGQMFEFLATMVEVGRRGAPHIMLLWEVNPTGKALLGQELTASKASAQSPGEERANNASALPSP